MQQQPEMKISHTGTKRWYLNGKFHREDGPAIEHISGEKQWYLHGNLHRENGPAIEQPNGERHWYLNNRRYSFEEYIIKLEKLGLKQKVADVLFNSG